MIRVTMKDRSIPHEVMASFDGGKVMLRPASLPAMARHHQTRRLFHHEGQYLRLGDFTQALVYGGMPRQFGASEDEALWAADLTVDRFLLLGNGGVDCRCQFRAWLAALESCAAAEPRSRAGATCPPAR